MRSAIPKRQTPGGSRQSRGLTYSAIRARLLHKYIIRYPWNPAIEEATWGKKFLKTISWWLWKGFIRLAKHIKVILRGFHIKNLPIHMRAYLIPFVLDILNATSVRIVSGNLPVSFRIIAITFTILTTDVIACPLGRRQQGLFYQHPYKDMRAL